ncbi:hypothetical protein [Anaerocolumna xylanovorans]|uniref:Uncharacterized protein n=1 Tax=Anaerocolumna xylanovorans DSM 12503 TaxID=1121345 RepID=A0A1M7Y985_9FIRM|nr:hypothetical protein [Anaerocolumna xylanovorans]SHO49180.1 hypothetical protein SAMN02745217_02173 [Anaerocolumna xylanovorans DSM 12503]
MAKKPYCVHQDVIRPDLNYREHMAYATLKEARAACKGIPHVSIYKYTFDQYGNVTSCKSCRVGVH